MFAVLAIFAFAAFFTILGMEIGRYQRDKAYERQRRRMEARNRDLNNENDKLKADYASLEQEFLRSLEED